MQRNYQSRQRTDADNSNEVSLPEKPRKWKTNKGKEPMTPTIGERQLPCSSTVTMTEAQHTDADNGNEVSLPEKPPKQKRKKDRQPKKAKKNKKQRKDNS
jgi:hypothetical protein